MPQELQKIEIQVNQDQIMQVKPLSLEHKEIMTDAQKDIARKHIDKLINIFNRCIIDDVIIEQIAQAFNCKKNVATEIQKHLEDYYKQDDGSISYSTSTYLIKDYKFISLLEKCTGKKLTKEITSVDDIFNLFELVSQQSLNAFHKPGKLLYMYQHYYRLGQASAFINAIAPLSDHKDTNTKAEQLYNILDYFAIKDGDIISDDTKNMLRSPTIFQKFVSLVCSFFSEISAARIQDWEISKAIGFEPKSYQQCYKFQELQQDLDFCISISHQ